MQPLCIIVVITTLGLYTKAANIKPGDQPIQFPGSVRMTAADDDVHESCRELNYCQMKPTNYPEERFNEMFKNYKPLPQPVLVLDDLKNKYGSEDEANCASEVTFEPLYHVRRARDQPWSLVIQAPKRDYIQRIRIEKCRNAGEPCFEGVCSSIAFTPICKQHISTWKVLVAKGDNETEEIETDLDVSCSCFAKQLPYMKR